MKEKPPANTRPAGPSGPSGPTSPIGPAGDPARSSGVRPAGPADPPEPPAESAFGLRALLPGVLAGGGITLSETQLDALVRYAGLLREWNTRVNLTAITDDAGMAVRHFLDSLTLLRLLDAEQAGRGGGPLSLIDVGTGAGFPGVPLAIARPALRLTLLDSLQKRISFLETVIAELGLAAAGTVWSRAEDAGHDPRWRERFDIATARAVAPLAVLCEYLLPFVRRDGLMIAMKAQKLEEVEEAAAAIRILGGSLESVENFVLPGSDLTRTLVRIRKVAPTPEKYPRKAGLPERKPLV